MNYTLLMEMFRKNREYVGLRDWVASPLYGKKRPAAVHGLTDSAEMMMLSAFCEDFRDDDMPVLLVFQDEKRARNTREFLTSLGLHGLVYPARDYNFNNMTASHEYEHERIGVLSALYGIRTGEYEVWEKPDFVCTTSEALLQVTLPPSLLSRYTISLSMEEEVDSTALTERLLEAGYVKVDLVEGAG